MLVCGKRISDRAGDLWSATTVGDTATHGRFVAVLSFVGDAGSKTMRLRIAAAALCTLNAASGIDGDRWKEIVYQSRGSLKRIHQMEVQ